MLAKEDLKPGHPDTVWLTKDGWTGSVGDKPAEAAHVRLPRQECGQCDTDRLLAAGRALEGLRGSGLTPIMQELRKPPPKQPSEAQRR